MAEIQKILSDLAVGFRYRWSKSALMDDMNFIDSLRHLKPQDIGRKIASNIKLDSPPNLAVKVEASLILLSTALAACVATGKGVPTAIKVENPEGSGEGKPRIGLVTEASAGGNSTLLQQLNVVRDLSGRSDCTPQIITVQDGAGHDLVEGVCRVPEGTIMVTEKASGSDQRVINRELKAYVQKDKDGKPWALVLAYPDGSADDGVNPVMWYFLGDGKTVWIYPNGMQVEFEKGLSPFEQTVQAIINADPELKTAHADPGQPTELPPTVQTSTATPMVPTPVLTEAPKPTATLEAPITPAQFVPIEQVNSASDCPLVTMEQLRATPITYEGDSPNPDSLSVTIIPHGIGISDDSNKPGLSVLFPSCARIDMGQELGVQIAMKVVIPGPDPIKPTTFYAINTNPQLSNEEVIQALKSGPIRLDLITDPYPSDPREKVELINDADIADLRDKMIPKPGEAGGLQIGLEILSSLQDKIVSVDIKNY